ncbi:MAG: hypothetical protein Q7U04_00810 [Bacteriovorax sp.]|nr:hypothetical protein [Bacteriovorax sp.]
MYAKILLMTAILLSGQVYAQSTATTSPATTTKAKKKTKIKAPVAAATTPAPAVAVEEVKKEEAKKEVVQAPVLASASFANQTLTYVKDHFSANYHGEYYLKRRDTESTNENLHDIQDLKILHSPTIIYKPVTNWQVMASAEFKYSDQPPAVADVDYPNTFYRALFTLTRKNILTEKEHGIQLDAGIGRRQFNTGREQREITGKYPLGSYGNNRIFTTLTKTEGKHNASLFVQYLHNDYKKSSVTTWGHALEIIPTITLQLTDKLSYLFNDDINLYIPKDSSNARSVKSTHEMSLAFITYQWTEKFSNYYQFKYYHNENFTQAFGTQDDYLEHYIGFAYAYTPKAILTLEIGNEVAHARDGKDFFSNKAKYPEVAFYLDLAI